MIEESDNITLARAFLLSVGSYLIGSEYGTALGWGIWFITMAIN